MREQKSTTTKDSFNINRGAWIEDSVIRNGSLREGWKLTGNSEVAHGHARQTGILTAVIPPPPERVTSQDGGGLEVTVEFILRLGDLDLTTLEERQVVELVVCLPRQLNSAGDVYGMRRCTLCDVPAFPLLESSPDSSCSCMAAPSSSGIS